MSFNNKVPVAAVIIGAVGLATASGAAMAASSKSDYPPIVDKLSERFNLNKKEVAEMFEQQRRQHRADNQKMLADRLNQAVKDGTLTEAQKNELSAKLEDFRSQRQNSDSGRLESKKQARQQLKAWAEENSIDIEKLVRILKPYHGKNHFL